MTDRITMHNAAMPAFTQYLDALSKLLDKAENHAQRLKIEADVLLKARLYPDMYPLTNQVQFACDFAKGAVARLGGIEVSVFDDNEKSFGELRSRIAKTLNFIRSVEPEKLERTEARDISLRFGGQPLKFKGRPYLTGFALPSMLFHISIAYAILRQSGVDVGKADFFGNVPDGSAA